MDSMEDKSNAKVMNIVNREHCDDTYSQSERIKDVLSGMAIANGQRHADTLETIKDTEVGLDRANADRHADSVKTLKDVEVGLERSNSAKFVDTLKTIEEVGASLDKSGGDRYADIIKGIKDASYQAERANADRFASVVKNFGDIEVDLLRENFKTIQAVDAARSSSDKSDSITRESISRNFRDLAVENCESHCDIKERIASSKFDIATLMNTGVKDLLLEHKYEQNLMRELSAVSEKTALTNHYQSLLQFKDQAILAEQISCKQELQAERVTARQELQAERIAAEQKLLFLQLTQDNCAKAACCNNELQEKFCDLKAQVLADGGETRKLVNSLEMDRLREKAEKAEAKLAAFFARNVPPSSP